MKKQIIEKILEEWNVCSCDNSALADRLIKEFSPEGEYIKKADMEKILYTTNNAVRIGELFTELPTYSFPDREKIGTCSKCGKAMQKLKSIKHGKYDFWYCPTCFADMRGAKR